jgi:AcrR family transcriptional regulator
MNTPSLQRRQRQRARTRQQILDAARELFVQHGYDATSMRAIADRLEYTPTALYHHFRNKEALLSELCVQDFRSCRMNFQRIGHQPDPVERLRQIGAAYLAFALEYPVQYQFMFMTQRPHVLGERDDVAIGDPSEDSYAFLRQAVADAIAAGRLRPDLNDADQVAQMLWGALHGIISLHIIKGADPGIDWRDLEETATHAGQVMTRGLLRAEPV